MIGTEADFIQKAGFAEEVSVNWLTSNIYRKDQKAPSAMPFRQVKRQDAGTPGSGFHDPDLGVPASWRFN